MKKVANSWIKVSSETELRKNVMSHAKKLVLYSAVGMKFFSRAMARLACALEVI